MDYELRFILHVTSYGFRDMWSEESTQTGIVLSTFTLSLLCGFISKWSHASGALRRLHDDSLFTCTW